MKFSLFKNDRSTAKDELLLLLFILVCIGIGTALVATSPQFWIIDSAFSGSFGILWIITGVLFVPALIYRLAHNDKK